MAKSKTPAKKAERKEYKGTKYTGPLRVKKKLREKFGDIPVVTLENEGDDIVGKFLSARSTKTKFGQGIVATFEDPNGEKFAMFLGSSLRQQILAVDRDGVATGTPVEFGEWLHIVRAEEIDTDKGNPFVAYEVDIIEAP